MNRREFLTLALIGGTSLLIPNLVTSKPKFNFEFEYGNCFPYLGQYREIPDLPLKILHDDARTILPRGTYYEIRGSIPQCYGRDKLLAWYRAPYMVRRAHELTHMDIEGGYLFVSGHYA